MSALLLVVAGHDSSGRAGLDVDREAAAAQGAQALPVATAWTRQDAGGVRAVNARPPAEWLAEARALFARRPAALKLGLLPGATHVAAAAELAEELRARFGAGFPVVLDPVLAASSGERFLDAAGVAELLGRLAALAPVLTPNLPEAAELAGRSVGELAGLAGREAAAAALLARGARAVVVKGGHGAEDPVLDLLCRPGAPAERIEHARVPGPGLRGTGCRHASALAAGLALGLALPDAARAAGDWLAGRIAAAGG